MNYLSVEGLSKSYGPKVLFESITVGIEKGQKTAFIAQNGTGKSTLLKILAGIEGQDKGVVAFNKGINVGFLDQEPVLDTSLTIIDEVFRADNPKIKAIQRYEKALLDPEDGEAFNKALEQMDALNAWDIEVQIKQILSKLKLDDLNRQIEMLSGGQRKRVALAKVLINEPDFLILDEPTNHLDLESIEWLEDYLARTNMTLLMVTHDRYFLDRVCNEIIELTRGELYRYKGNYSYFLEKKQERDESDATSFGKAENLFKKELDWVRRQPQARGTKAKYRLDAFDDLKKKLSNRPNESGLELDITSKRIGKKILELKNLEKRFGTDLTILNNFTYTFKRKEKIGILGDNGVGKSTFLNILTGSESVDSGEVIKGETIEFGYYHQNGLIEADGRKMIEVVKDIAEVIPLSNGKTVSASQLLERFLFSPEKQYQLVSTLSGGERKRLYLLTVLMKNPNFLILDEPTNDLDIMTLNILEDFLQQFAGCLLIVSHDRYFMDKLVDHMFIFQGDGIIRDFNGSCSDYLELKQIEQELAKKEEAEEKVAQKVEKAKEESTTKKKLSYKEKVEFETLEKDIEALEGRKKELEGNLSTETDASKVMELSEEFGKVNEELEEKTMRWLELSEYV